MSNLSSRKRNLTIAWILLLVGAVLAVDGLLQLVAGNSDRMGEASLGGVLTICSSFFFIISRPGKAIKND